MKKHIIISLLIITIALCCAFALSGCSKGTEKNYDFLITFDYNESSVGLDGDTYENQYLGVKDGSLAMRPLVNDGSTLYQNSDFKETQIKGYEVEGWYLPVFGGDGEAMTENGKIVLGKQWDFKRDKVTADVTLYAKLSYKPTITLMVDGKVDTEKNYSPNTSVSRTSFKALDPKKTGYTFYGYYADEALTEKFTFPYVMGNEGITIYARFIEGENWKIVTTAQEFNNAYHASAKIYVDDDLDFTGVQWKAGIEFSGSINGNGHKLTGINCDIWGTIETVQTNLGLFGQLKKDSYIYDIIFENVTVTINTIGKNLANAALFAWNINEEAKLENVTVSGNISKGSIAEGSTVDLYGVCVNSNYQTIATVKDCNFAAIVINND